MRKILGWLWPFDFGWASLAFADRLKLLAFFVQAGAGVAMSGFAAYAMYVLATLKATWPVFYMGAGAMVIIGIVITGLAGLLIKRNVSAEGAGFKFASQDIEGMRDMLQQAPTTVTQTVTTPEGQPDITTTTTSSPGVSPPDPPLVDPEEVLDPNTVKSSPRQG